MVLQLFKSFIYAFFCAGNGILKFAMQSFVQMWGMTLPFLLIKDVA